MPRNISNILTDAPAAEQKAAGSAPIGAIAPEPTKAEEERIDGLAERIVECDKYTAEGKALRPELLSAMQSANLESRTTGSGIVAKVIETRRDSFNEEGFIEWAKAHGHADLVKTVTTEAVDMDKLEKLVYAEVDGEAHALTDAVKEYTTTTTSFSVRINVPKPKKEKEAK